MTRDKFLHKRWGIFIHYLNSLQNNSAMSHSMGRGETAWDSCVQDLDVELLARQAAEAGAGYVIFTVMQASRYMIAPNSVFNDITGYQNGEACASRDLIEDLYTALTKREIDLFLYFTGDGPSSDPQTAEKFGASIPVTEPFVRKWAAVLEEYSCRYGDKIKGWWLDGMYNAIGYTDEKLISIMREAIKKGNPDALIANNYHGCFANGHTSNMKGIGDVIFGDFYQTIAPPTPYCDFTAGEVVEFNVYPEQTSIDGALPHVLSFLGIPAKPVMVYDGWGKPGSKYTGEYMRRYVEQVNQLGGVVSIDVCLYRDGHIDPTQLQVLRHI